MTGNQDITSEMAAWIDGGRAMLIAECDRVMESLTKAKLEPGNALAAVKHLRAIQFMMKVMPAVALMCLPDQQISASKLKRALKTSGLNFAETSEEDMTAHERDDSPENLERLRAEFIARIARTHAAFETKGGDRDGECGPAARDERDPV